MATPLTDITGIGSVAAASLEAAGFKTAEDVANATSGTLSVVRGFGPARSAIVINAAKTLCGVPVAVARLLPARSAVRSATAKREPAEKKKTPKKDKAEKKVKKAKKAKPDKKAKKAKPVKKDKKSKKSAKGKKNKKK